LGFGIVSFLPGSLAADLENMISLIFLISSLQSIRDSAAREIIGDPRLERDTRARLAEGSPKRTTIDVRDPHLSLKRNHVVPSKPSQPTTTTVASKFEMA
jgi:hypothetical protein